MLKQRIFTAIFLIALLLAVIYALPIVYFAWAVGIAVMLAAWEWTGLSGITRWYLRVAYLAFLIFAFLLINYYPVSQSLMFISSLAIGWWMWSIIWILRFQRQVMTIEHNPWFFSLIGLFILLPFWYCIVMLNFEQKFNPAAGQLLLFVIIIVAIADTTAYFVGKRWGKHKLASNVSPGKTWEGLCGAVFAVSLLILPIATALGITQFSRVELTGIGLILVIAALVGDLFESLVKRIAGVKDSGTLLPGHGGILDRIDAHLAAIPVFTVIYFYMQL